MDGCERCASDGILEARRLGHVYTLCHALFQSGFVTANLKSPSQALPEFQELRSVAHEHGIAFFEICATIMMGWCLCQMGERERGWPQLSGGVAAYRSSGCMLYVPSFLRFEAEALAINSSTDTVDAVGDSNYSAGAANILRSNGAGDSVVYLVPNISSGTYTVSVGMKKNTSRGQFQLAASRADQNTYTNIGSVIDEYSNSSGDYVEVTAGSWTPGTTNDKLFRFSVTGKNAGSDQFWLSVDYIHLTKQ